MELTTGHTGSVAGSDGSWALQGFASKDAADRAMDLLRRFERGELMERTADIDLEQDASFKEFVNYGGRCNWFSDTGSEPRINVARYAWRAALYVAAGMGENAAAQASMERPAKAVAPKRTCPHLSEVAEQTAKWWAGLLSNLQFHDYLLERVIAPAAPDAALGENGRLPLMNAAFTTTVAYAPEKRYEMRFSFNSLAALHAAHDQWLAFAHGVHRPTDSQPPRT